MKLPRRNLLHLAAGAVALPAVSPFAWAQTYPTRPVHVIVGFTASNNIDIVARLIGQWLSASWPLSALAQEGERARRIGVLMGYAEIVKRKGT